MGLGNVGCEKIRIIISKKEAAGSSIPEIIDKKLSKKDQNAPRLTISISNYLSELRNQYMIFSEVDMLGNMLFTFIEHGEM